MDLEKQISVYCSQKFFSDSVQYYWQWTYSANNEIHHILVNTYAGTARFFTKMAAIYVDTHFLFAGTTAKKNISASLKLSFASYRYRIYKGLQKYSAAEPKLFNFNFRSGST